MEEGRPVNKAAYSEEELYTRNNEGFEEAANKTTHLGIGAHPDDIEFFAYHGILNCYDDPIKNFSGITLCDGAGSPRSGSFVNYNDEEMAATRQREQIEAAKLGHYAFQVQLGMKSKELKESNACVEKLKGLIEKVQPEVIYTHNLADKHDTHVAAALRVIDALKKIEDKSFLKNFYGCEIWRDLDWLVDDKKIRLDVSGRPDLAAALSKVYKSQIEGGKAYDEAVIARRKAHAVFDESHAQDIATAYTFAIDYMPLLLEKKSAKEFMIDLIKDFQNDVEKKVLKYEL